MVLVQLLEPKKTDIAHGEEMAIVKLEVTHVGIISQQFSCMCHRLILYDVRSGAVIPTGLVESAHNIVPRHLPCLSEPWDYVLKFFRCVNRRKHGTDNNQTAGELSNLNINIPKNIPFRV